MDAATLSTHITTCATQLRSLTQKSCQPQWHQSLENYPATIVLANHDWQNWALAPLNNREHIAWHKGKQSIWLCQEITVPTALSAFPLAGLSLRLGLTWWADTVEVYVDGVLVQQGDLFDYFVRLPLSDRVSPGDTFTIAVHMLSPGHDAGALVRSEVIYESFDPDLPEPGFVADELTVLQIYAEKLAPAKLSEIAAAIAPLDWSKVSHPDQFQAELVALRQRLHPLSDWIKQRQIVCTGHAHLDLAWLWPVEATWRAAERTFCSVLSLQSAFPELTYTHSSPALFDWLETHQPDLFQQVLAGVEAGTWAIDAGLWVEPELNTIGGESLARQILYGQRYSRSRFGQASAIAWLPDCFGFSWQLPQLLKLGQIEYFATQKLRWNEVTPFPHSLFWWQGLDGTQILSLTLPPIGTDVDPIQMATHSADWEAKTHLPEMLWLPGMGDHGGGPTRDMLAKARRWSNSPFFPDLQFTSVLAHLHHITHTYAPSPPPYSFAPQLSHSSPSSPPLSPSPLPTWQNELYLELHRGCYTVHADQKWFNRRCEDALREAELFAALAHMQTLYEYPQAALENAWKQALFNQFHDILPGTAIPEVFETTNPAWQAAYDTAKQIRSEALVAIAQHLPLETVPYPNAMPIVVFNSLNWEHTDLVEVALADLPLKAEGWDVFDPVTEGWMVAQLSDYTERHDTPPCSPQKAEEASPRLLFLATVPVMGYRVFWLVPKPVNAESTAPAGKRTVRQNPRLDQWVLENDLVQAVIDPTTGNMTELWEKQTPTQVVRSPANQLQAFQDSGQYWDAWDIAPDYEAHPLSETQLKSITWLEHGPLRQRLRVIRQFGNSVFQQDYVLDQHLPYLKVSTVADWHETQVVLKTAFPLAIESDHATYEIPFGAIARPTNSADPHEQAKWEVPALRWADMSDGAIGFSILTDYKHGFDAKPDQLRLTLLKAPLWPDPQADRGRHQFTYGLYPHAGDWRTGKTPNHAIAFNTPLQSVVINPSDPITSVGMENVVPSQQSFLDVGTDRVQVTAFKLAEDTRDRYILRCWDLYGEGSKLQVTTPWGTPTLESVNLLEDPLASNTIEEVTPWQIVTGQFSWEHVTFESSP